MLRLTGIQPKNAISNNITFVHSMNRRSFVQSLRSVGVLGASSILASQTNVFAAHLTSSQQLLSVPEKRLYPPTLPPALKPGMKVGIPAPASGVTKDDAEKKVKAFATALEGIGLVPVIAKSIVAANSYLAAPDEVRAQEFMDFVRNPEIGAIICVRGGYGVMRILPMLDFTTIQQNPKIISGFSDHTALVNTIYDRCNLVAFHGPMAVAEFDDFTRQWFLPLVYPDLAKQQKFEPLTYVDTSAKLTTLAPGKARGRIVGGNLTMLTALMGTPYEVNTDGAILFLEDVGETAYKIDRMLTQLWLAGKLQSCAGIVLGQFTEGKDSTYATTVEEALKSRLSPLKIPVLGNFPLGHVKEKFTMPIGVMAELDADSRKFTLLEAAVRY